MLGIDVGMVERIAHRPQYRAFEFERRQRLFLLVRSARLPLHVIKREVGIAGRLRWALVEIGERLAGDERITCQHPFHALIDDLRREQFGKR